MFLIPFCAVLNILMMIRSFDDLINLILFMASPLHIIIIIIVLFPVVLLSVHLVLLLLILLFELLLISIFLDVSSFLRVDMASSRKICGRH